MDFQFVISLTNHKTLGYIPQAMLVNVRENESFFRIHQILGNRKEIPTYNLKDTEKEIAISCTDLQEDKISSVFCKNPKNRRIFLEKAEPSLIKDQVIPYIHRRMVSILAKARESGIPVYLRSEKISQLYFENRLELILKPAEVIFYVFRNSEETRYTLKIINDKGELSLQSKNTAILSIQPCNLLIDKKIFFFGNNEDDINGKVLTPFFTKEFIIIRKDLENQFFSGFFKKIIRKHRFETEGVDVLEKIYPCTPLFSIQPNLELNPVFVLEFNYSGFKIVPYLDGAQGSIQFDDINGRIIKYRRNYSFEDNCKAFLESIGLKQVLKSVFYPNEENESQLRLYNLIYWLGENKEKLESFGFLVAHSWNQKNYSVFSPSINLISTKSQDWFDIEAFITIGEYKIPFYEFRFNILNHIPEYQLPNGDFFLLPEEWFSRYRNLMLFGTSNNWFIRIKKYHFRIIDDISNNSFKSQIPDFSQFEKLAGKEYIPIGLNATLRPYQETGLKWMYFLYKEGLGGCLADDMGLGKTIQTIAFLCKINDEFKSKFSSVNPNKQIDLFSTQAEKSGNNSFLIVCPTSLVHNWKIEILRFAPSLTVLDYTGTNRKQNGKLTEIVCNYDIVLTSYGVLRNDIDDFQSILFNIVILDESQFIKNPFSKIYQAVLLLNSTNNYVLTGTPIENSLTDLWSQINFVNRGILGGLAFFREKFEIQLEKEGIESNTLQLKSLIEPFILRRTKEEVAPELPELTEQVIYCTMTDEQKSTYEAEKSKIRNLIFESIGEKGIAKSSFVILKGLTMLRQIASHPGMVLPEFEGASGKFEEITRSLETIIGENHKVLVFSPFVKHLNLLSQFLCEQNIGYEILTGQSRNRNSIISSFRQNAEKKVFLISIKAGGFGLNLPEADYVFILDPWWNPSVEAQAISRSHRIGQTSRVFAYRFITLDSIEEKINALQKWKNQLADSVIKSNNPFRTLEHSEITDLLS
jgi:SNF2 family DNA or RNA helicase